jgi:hypothetical protein
MRDTRNPKFDPRLLYGEIVAEYLPLGEAVEALPEERPSQKRDPYQKRDPSQGDLPGSLQQETQGKP